MRVALAAPRSIAAPRDMPAYAVSQRVRKRVEEIFGWMKTVGPGDSAVLDF
jgi:hypothetical protein